MINHDNNEWQLENIPSIWVTFWVLKLDKFNDNNEWQLENIPSIWVTFWVLKLDKFNDDNEFNDRT